MSEDKGSIRIRVPDAFNGDKKKARTFLRSVKQYIQIEDKKFKNDEERIIWAMSYMPEGEAAQFGDNIYAEFFDNDKNITFKEWIEKFKERFMSSNLKDDAMSELSVLKQGTETVDIYNAKFKALMIEAEISDGITVIDLYKKGLNRPLAERLYLMEVMPKTLEDWMSKASIFDNQWRRFNTERPTVRKPTITKKPFFKRSGQNRAILTDKEKEEYRKEGKCFNCGKKGHRSFDCPDKNNYGKTRQIEEETKEDLKEKKKERKENPSKGKFRQMLMDYLDDSDEDF